MDAHPEIFNTLLVEDDPLARWITRKALEEAGAAVTEAEDCAAARDVLDRMRFNLLVLDYRLPDGNGLDVLRYVRSKGHNDKAIVLSAEADIFTAAIQEELDIQQVFSKPVPLGELQDCLSALQKDASPAAVREGDVVDGAQEKRWVDRFQVLRMPEQVTEEGLTEQLPKEQDVWLALDFSVCREMDAAVPEYIAALAGRCRTAAGRLVLLRVSDKMKSSFWMVGGGRDFDMVDEMRELEALSRRVASYCERAALLDSIIQRPVQVAQE